MSEDLYINCRRIPEPDPLQQVIVLTGSKRAFCFSYVEHLVHTGSFAKLSHFLPFSTPLSTGLFTGTVRSVVVLSFDFFYPPLPLVLEPDLNMNPRLDMTFCSLVAHLTVVLLWMVVAAAATTFPATVEVDLVFPRNDTYAPSALFPIVFAFQNAALAPSLDPGFDLELWDISSSSLTGYSPALDLTATNFSRSDPLYVYTFVTNLAAAAYRLQWNFDASNCSDQAGSVNVGGGFQNNSVAFTIQTGAQPPDLASTTASCVNTSHFAFNLTGMLDDGIPAPHDGRKTCAVYSDVKSLVAGNPCAVHVGAAAASSISAALTATACAAMSPVVSCPSISAASGGRDTGLTGCIVMLGGLVAALVAM